MNGRTECGLLYAPPFEQNSNRTRAGLFVGPSSRLRRQSLKKNAHFWTPSRGSTMPNRHVYRGRTQKERKKKMKKTHTHSWFRTGQIFENPFKTLRLIIRSIKYNVRTVVLSSVQDNLKKKKYIIRILLLIIKQHALLIRISIITIITIFH